MYGVRVSAQPSCPARLIRPLLGCGGAAAAVAAVAGVGVTAVVTFACRVALPLLIVPAGKSVDRLRRSSNRPVRSHTD